MLENLNNLVREEAEETIVKNPAIPNEKNEEAIQAASGSIEEVLKEKASSGNFGDLSQLFQGGDFANNPIVNKIKEVFAGKLGNMGVDGSSAGSVAGGIIPALIEKFVRRTNDPNDKGFDLQSMLKQFAGDDGKFDLNDVMGMFNKKGDQQQRDTGEGTGGLGDTIGGFFK
ncbi:hypothetical protein GZH53_10550 [Flavihumibacter sp. R14]|nr:hypothetical protein [Flavihumibacter soli]